MLNNLWLCEWFDAVIVIHLKRYTVILLLCCLSRLLGFISQPALGRVVVRKITWSSNSTNTSNLWLKKTVNEHPAECQLNHNIIALLVAYKFPLLFVWLGKKSCRVHYVLRGCSVIYWFVVIEKMWHFTASTKRGMLMIPRRFQLCWRRFMCRTTPIFQ